ncbi:MAG: cobalamin-dependent protein [Hyphomicrobiaceae bacterium]
MDKRLSDRILPQDLPKGAELLAEGHKIARTFSVGKSLLCREFGAASEADYKRKMVADGRIMTCMNFGPPTWPDARIGLQKVWDETAKRGFRIDRFTFQMDRRMGLPKESWDKASKETGPMLVEDKDWYEVANTVPIQPGLGDMMIGSPNSVSNAVAALQAGVSYVGNMSQFSWNYPTWDGDDVAQMSEMVKALGIMAAKKADGAVVQSYLDDGYCAQFTDYTSFIGWTLFERYVIEDVIGSAVSITWGGLTHDPRRKAAVTMALEAIKPEGRYNAFYHCDTTHYEKDLQRNYAALSLDVLFLALTELRLKTGAAILPIPVTEPIRVPTLDETMEAHNITRRIIDDAPRLMELVNWEPIEAERDRLVAGGKVFFRNLLEGLGEMGVDLKDPLQLLIAVRRLGATEIERRFGAASTADPALPDYEPLVATDTFKDYVDRREQIRNRITRNGTEILRPMTVIVGSSDVHEFGMNLVTSTLEALGLKPVVAGVDIDPDEFAELAKQHQAKAILVSTHNGMALSYAEKLKAELKSRSISVRIIMGGTLNQDVEGEEVPRDMTDELQRLGVTVCREIDDIYPALQAVA